MPNSARWRSLSSRSPDVVRYGGHLRWTRHGSTRLRGRGQLARQARDAGPARQCPETPAPATPPSRGGLGGAAGGCADWRE